MFRIIITEPKRLQICHRVLRFTLPLKKRQSCGKKSPDEARKPNRTISHKFTLIYYSELAGVKFSFRGIFHFIGRVYSIHLCLLRPIDGQSLRAKHDAKQSLATKPAAAFTAFLHLSDTKRQSTKVK